MASLGNTGTCGLSAEKIDKLNSHPIAPTLCDECKKKPGTHWFGLTALVICGSAECVASAQQRYDDDFNNSDY